MNFTERLSSFRRELFPSHLDRLVTDASRERREVMAQRQSEYEALQRVKQDCAVRLAPHVGRLMLVANFKGHQVPKQAIRIAEAVATVPELSQTELLGVSVHLVQGRSRINQISMAETGLFLAAALINGGRATDLYDEETPVDIDHWLPSIVRAAERTSSEYPQCRTGHLAVIGALDLQCSGQADIPSYVNPGTALQLVSVDTETARLGWKVAAFDPRLGNVYEPPASKDA